MTAEEFSNVRGARCASNLLRAIAVTRDREWALFPHCSKNRGGVFYDVKIKTTREVSIRTEEGRTGAQVCGSIRGKAKYTVGDLIITNRWKIYIYSMF